MRRKGLDERGFLERRLDILQTISNIATGTR